MREVFRPRGTWHAEQRVWLRQNKQRRTEVRAPKCAPSHRPTKWGIPSLPRAEVASQVRRAANLRFRLPALPAVPVSLPQITFDTAVLARICSSVGRLLSPELPCYGLDARERRARLAGVHIALLLGVGIVLCRLFSLQARDHEKWLTLAERQHETSIQIQGARGTVHDRAGRALVASIETSSVAIRPRLVQDRQTFIDELSRLAGVPKQTVVERLDSGKNFLWLAKGMPREVGAKISAANLRGVEVLSEFQRIHPHGDLASVVLGRVSNSGEGQSGVERFYNKQLAAPNHVLELRRDARGRYFSAGALDDPQSEEEELSSRIADLRRAVGEIPLVQVAFADRREEQPEVTTAFRAEGGDIALTIDVLLQEILEDEIAKGREDAKAKRVFGILMDADSGELLSIAQEPKALLSAQAKVSPEDLRNVAIQDSLEPGSTLKPLVAALALQRKLISIDELIDCENGNYPVGRHVIRDVHPVQIVPVSEVLVRSSNVGMAKIGQRMGLERLPKALRELGFGAPTGVELPGEAKGIFKRDANWKQIDVVTASFGQGVSTTPIQLVRAYAALANGGWLVKPTIRYRAERDATAERVRVFDESVAKQITDSLVGVTMSEHGTGKQAALAGLAVAGKTGTAEKPRKDGRGYDPDHVFSSFIGYVDGRPIGVERRLVMYVGVDEPGVKPRWGGVVAAPVFRRAMERVLSQLMTERRGSVQTAGLKRRDSLS